MLEDVRQVPVLTGCRLVERTRLGLDEREVVQWVGDEYAFVVATRSPRNLFARRSAMVCAC